MSRLRVFDAMRGFSMLLVIMGHVMMLCGLEATDITLFGVIVTFNMPIFFLMSGYFAYKPVAGWTPRKLGGNLRLKISALVVCTLVFYALLYYSRSQDPLGWIQKGFGSYWFTITLFEIFLTYYAAILISKALRRDLILPFMVSVALAGLVLMIWNPWSEQHWWNVVGGSNYCLYMQYFTMGMLFKRYKNAFVRVLTDGRVAGLLMVVYVGLLCFMHSNMEQYGLIGRIYRVFALPYTGVWMVISLFLMAKEYFDRKNPVSDGLCLIGERSLEIYMIHYFFLPPMPFMHDWLAPNSMVLFQLLISVGIALPIIGICIVLGSMIRKSGVLAELLFGVRRA